jgi:DNA mismatch endonuclease, patch repair protein
MKQPVHETVLATTGRLNSKGCLIWRARFRHLVRDRFTKEQRSEIMSRIRSTGTRIELLMKEGLESKQIGFQYQPKLFGKPDFLVDPKIAIFCDSSFWHGREWSRLRKKLSSAYWYDHIKKNRRRDGEVTRRLSREGYVVLRFWDTELESSLGDCIGRIEEAVQSQRGPAQEELAACR